MATTSANDRPASGFKDTIEAIVITFLVAFMFRAYVVEAFEIPTGSMAPTLYGRHMDLRCSQCGFHFATDVPTLRPQQSEEVVCPMCNHLIVVKQSMRDSAGDRILVQKYLYTIQEPKRWDVVVFKNPENPSVNFIKRLVGLPEEAVWVIDGNIYTRKSGELDGLWRIARKTERIEAQNAVWQPVYHSAYVPLDRGTDGDDRQRSPWSCPWIAVKGDWNLASREGYQLKADSAGNLASKLQFNSPEVKYPYSASYDTSRSPSWRHPIEDLRLAATVILPKDAGEFEAVLKTTARLDDMTTSDAMSKNPSLSNSHMLRARFAMNGAVVIERLDAEGKPVTLAQGQAPAMEPGGLGRRIELWYVDDEASAWVDGKRIAAHAFDGAAGGWSASQLIARAPCTATAALEIDLHGKASGARLVNVDFDHDLYYASGNAGGGAGKQGTLLRYATGAEGQPIELEADQFFCLGDNSPWSMDGRLWPTVDPWIEARMLNNNLQRVGVVPRRLMMGRAFFVYFPAPHRFNLADNELMIVPNFADMRMIH